LRQQSSPMRILFVCTGNTCRSPMAEAYFRHLCDVRGMGDVRVDSAGVAAIDGTPQSRQGVEALRRRGVSPPVGASLVVTRELIEAADLIVAMTASHEETLAARCPEGDEKIHLLLDFADETGDVADPYGGTVAEYVACLDGMVPALENLADIVQAALNESE